MWLELLEKPMRGSHVFGTFYNTEAAALTKSENSRRECKKLRHPVKTTSCSPIYGSPGGVKWSVKRGRAISIVYRKALGLS